MAVPVPVPVGPLSLQHLLKLCNSGLGAIQLGLQVSLLVHSTHGLVLQPEQLLRSVHICGALDLQLAIWH